MHDPVTRSLVTPEREAQARERARREFVAMQASPFFSVWASAAVDEVLSALHEKLTVKPGGR